MVGLIHKLKQIDQLTTRVVSSWPHPKVVVALMWGLTISGYGGMIWIGLSLLVSLQLADWSVFWSMAIAQGFGFFVVTILIKAYVKRPRPSLSLDDRIAAVVGYTSYSFPSGHAASSIIAFIIIVFFSSSSWAWMALLSFLIVFSRLYLNKHYLTDIIAGVGIGLVLGLSTIAILIST